MFNLTEEWLFKYYGSTSPGQDVQAVEWIKQWTKVESNEKIQRYKRWKHLVEYMANDREIVDKALAMVGMAFRSELDVHRTMSWLRYQNYVEAIEEGLQLYGSDGPESILELGVGGDSGLSTGVFLNWLDKNGFGNRNMLSVDVNPLGMTFERYKDVPFWSFVQTDSVSAISEIEKRGKLVDMVFIDTIHSYDHTLAELRGAEKITDYIMLDDMLFEGNNFDPNPGGVKRALAQWLEEKAGEWEFFPLTHSNQVGIVFNTGPTGGGKDR
jgi:cephalosporin hydroxylase